MNASLIRGTKLLTMVGLATVALLEALRPGTVGAATNLGVVVVMASAFLVLEIKKAPTSDSKGE